jgi:peptidoglycan hydrolase-like protein with peptidoglycan-binding domain
VGYGRPPYDGAGRVTDSPKEFKSKASFTTGDSGADVRMWQRQLNAVMEADLDVDGNFGPETFKVTKQFQEKYDLEVDGEVGPKSLHKMEKVFMELKRGHDDKPPVLEMYDSGPWVKKAQKKLSDLGFDLGPDGADGDFGTVTAAAVKAFKEKHDLPRTAVVGPRVWKELGV